MTKKSFVSVSRVVLLLILTSLLLTGCGCKHEWQAADCNTPKTCAKCQVTEGEPLNHTWADATCDTPKTCTACNKTEGEALAHTWVEVSCAAPKHCSVCNATEGEALAHTWVKTTCTTPRTCSVCNFTEDTAPGHTWRDANCVYPKYCPVCYAEEGSALGHQWMDATIEAPKTCKICGATEGSKIIPGHFLFTTSACKPLFGTWTSVTNLSAKDIIGEGCVGTLDLQYAITFENDGYYQESTTIINKDQFEKNVENYYIEQLYKELAAQGYSQAQADEAMKIAYGMDVKAYAHKLATSLNYSAIFSSTSSGVYYVFENYLYTGSKNSISLSSDIFSISGKTLTIKSRTNDSPDLVLTKS